MHFTVEGMVGLSSKEAQRGWEIGRKKQILRERFWVQQGDHSCNTNLNLCYTVTEAGLEGMKG